MRKLLLNECHVTLELRLPPDSRMLVAESRPERRGAEEREVTVAVQENGRPYLPGSSLKGVFRNRAEYIGNVIKRNGVGACHLFSGPLPEQGSSADVRLSCGERFRVRINAADRRQHELSMPERYRDACPICQLFGHTFWAGRIRFTDFVTLEAVEEERPHVAIDRMTGGAAGGKLFKMASLSNARFKGQITLENFSLWQLGLLGLLLEDLKDGLLRVGHNTTSGSGRLSLENASVTVRSLGVVVQGQIDGLGTLLDDSMRNHYGYAGEDKVALPGISWQRQGLWQEAQLNQSTVDTLWGNTRQSVVDFFDQFSFAQSMEIPFLYQLQRAQEEVV